MAKDDVLTARNWSALRCGVPPLLPVLHVSKILQSIRSASARPYKGVTAARSEVKSKWFGTAAELHACTPFPMPSFDHAAGPDAPPREQLRVIDWTETEAR
jgi:hypothetical protein